MEGNNFLTINNNFRFQAISRKRKEVTSFTFSFP
ncbi:unnamed protein product, partial [marine sediment metagenome]